MIGKTASGFRRRDDSDAFENEVDILHQVRTRFDLSMRQPEGGATPDIAGLARLTFTYCTGWEDDAASVLPTQAPRGVPLFFIAMEELPGGTLWDRLRAACGLLPPQDLWQIALDLMSGLAALHALGFAHSDLK